MFFDNFQQIFPTFISPISVIFREENVSFVIIQFRCPCVTDRLDFILLTQFIKIVNTKNEQSTRHTKNRD